MSSKVIPTITPPPASPRPTLTNTLTFGPFTWHLYILAALLAICHKLTNFVHPYLHMTVDVVVIIYTGAFLSLKFFTLVKKPVTQALTVRDMWWRYPLYAAGILLTASFAVQYMGRVFVNSFLMVYFCYIGTYAIKYWIDDLLSQNDFMNALKGMDSPLLSKLRIKLSRFDLIGFSISATIIMLYILNKDWLANNICGIAFCLYGIKSVYVGKFKAAFSMLAMFLLYDIYFVFGSTIMETLATGIDGPIKLLFPREDRKFALLGLGDILVPGVVISLCLRFDVFLYFRKRLAEKEGTLKEVFPENSSVFPKPYFTGSLIGYIVGFIVAIITTALFHIAQPALLYLVPGVSIGILVTAAIRGEVKEILAFDEEEEAKKLAGESKKNGEKKVQRRKV